MDSSDETACYKLRTSRTRSQRDDTERVVCGSDGRLCRCLRREQSTVYLIEEWNMEWTSRQLLVNRTSLSYRPSHSLQHSSKKRKRPLSQAGTYNNEKQARYEDKWNERYIIPSPSLGWQVNFKFFWQMLLSYGPACQNICKQRFFRRPLCYPPLFFQSSFYVPYK